MKKQNIKLISMSVAAAFYLTACGSSGSTEGVSGFVTGSYYEGATVYLDCNNNGAQDANEASVVSASNGSYTLYGSTACNIVANIPVGALKHTLVGDAGVVVSTQMKFAAPAGTGGVLSALSTKVYDRVMTGSSLSEAKSYVANSTGLSIDDLFKDVNTIPDSALKDKIKLVLQSAELAMVTPTVTVADKVKEDETVTNTPSYGSSTGVAVDPYISQAKFYVVGKNANIGSNGLCGAQTSFVSTTTNASGVFSFTDTIPLNSIVKICQDYKGYHNGIPFDSNLSSKFSDDNDDGTLSPTTTIVANGLSAVDIASVLNDPNQDGDYSDGVGYPDYNLTADDIYDDPMYGLSTASTDTNVTFAKIRSTVAVNMMMKMRNSFSMTTKSDMNQSGILASSLTMMKTVLNTDLDAGGFSADKIAKVAISISDAITEDLAPIIATGVMNDVTAAIGTATSKIPTIAQALGTKIAMNASKSFRVRKGSAANWDDVTIIETIPSGSDLTVSGRMMEINNERNITFYSDGSYSEVNTTEDITLYGSYFTRNRNGAEYEEGNADITIVEDNVSGVLTIQPTKHWTFKGDTVSLSGGEDLNITDVNSSLQITLAAQSDLNGTKIQLSGDTNASGSTIVSRTFDTNGTYRQFTGGLTYQRGVWSLYEGTTADYNITLDGNITDVNLSLSHADDPGTPWINEANISIMQESNLSVLSSEKLQY